METGEYFLLENEKKEKKLQEKMRKQAEKAQ